MDYGWAELVKNWNCDKTVEFSINSNDFSFGKTRINNLKNNFSLTEIVIIFSYF